jgi:hypothetical protein
VAKLPDRKESEMEMETTTIRVSTDVQTEVARLAAIRGVSAGDLLGQAWREFLDNNKDLLANDLEQVAEILRSGSTEDLAEFLSRDADERARAAAARARA